MLPCSLSPHLPPPPPTNKVLTEEVDRKYANRVVLDVGLAICLYDFVEVGDAYLYPSDGAAHHRGASRPTSIIMLAGWMDGHSHRPLAWRANDDPSNL